MTQQEGYVHPEFVADTAWLAEHLEDGDLRVVDTDVTPAYQRGHIPGAVLVPDNFEKDPDTNRVHLMNSGQFKAMCQGLGIGDDTLVVTYDNGQSLTAARLWWALNTYGHSNVKVLDGGWRRWVSEGRAVSFASSPAASGVTFTLLPDDFMLF